MVTMLAYKTMRSHRSLRICYNVARQFNKQNRERQTQRLCSMQWCSRKEYSSAAEQLQEPQIQGTEKEYSPKIERIVDEISQLTLLEVCDLNELLKTRLKIKDGPVMAMAGPAVAAPKEEEEEVAPKREKNAFTVKLVKFDDSKKITLIKELKNIIPDINLVQAKKFVEAVPQVVKADIMKEEAEKLKSTIEAVGGVVELE
ncbi:large ribosomal subunit protein bL12m-like [Saccostrea echinata]|uniref:large ribosomal subunit protein bL12m-like n=1 Tax=Saccostrea echinata TaxID=191078 RepID=UPI002A7F711D|nr:large ribosomal subunit protein bL12m-like [Saccostrea echinata]